MTKPDEAGEAGEEAAVPTGDAPVDPPRKRKKKKTPTADAGTPAPVWAPVGALRAGPAYGLALLSGLLYFLGFPGMDLWPISLFALVPLLVALRNQPPRRAAGLGWMAGFTMTMSGFYWLLEMLRVFSGFPTILCVFFMSILCAYQAGRIALAGWLYGRAAARGWPAPIVFALAFAASELVFPLLFPWYFGASVHNAPALMQISDIGGPILVGLVLVAPNLALAELLEAWRSKRSIDRRLVASGLLVPALAALYGLVRIRSVDAAAAAAEPVKIGIVQGNMPLFDRKTSVPVHKRLTKELRDQGVQLVVWSEAAIPRSYPEGRYEADVKASLTGDLGVASIVGTVLRRAGTGPSDSPEARGRSFNTALMAGEDGKVLGRYDKQFLLMFGEYLPFGEALPVLYKWSPNSGRFTPGDSIEPLPWGEHKISALICYEDILPTFVNKVVRHADPDLLVNMTNDSWFGDSTEPWIHLALAKLRAVEHRRYLVRATNSGVSAIVDPVGRLIAHGQPFVTTTVVGEARFMRATTGYEIIGDIPWYLAAAAIAAMSVFSRPRKAA